MKKKGLKFVVSQALIVLWQFGFLMMSGLMWIGVLPEIVRRNSVLEAIYGLGLAMMIIATIFYTRAHLMNEEL